MANKIYSCYRCKGDGKVWAPVPSQIVELMINPAIMEIVCPICNGSGRLIKKLIWVPVQ